MKTILELRRERESLTPIRKMINLLNHLCSNGVDTDIPLKLVEEVVDKLNIDWYNPHLKILDIKSNKATFSLIIIEKLLEHGHHIDHILDNMIYAIDGDKIQSMTSNKAFLNAFKRSGNIYHEDFLTWKTDLKFDLIVGNPPYIKNTHLEFLVKSCQLADTVSLIHPAGWVFRNNSKIEHNVREIIRGRLKSLTLFNGNFEFKGMNFGAPLVLTQVVKQHNQNFTLNYKTSGNSYSIKSLENIPRGIWEPSDDMLKLISKYEDLTVRENLSSMIGSNKGRSYISIPEFCGVLSKDSQTFCSKDYWIFFTRSSKIYELNDKKVVINVNNDSERDSLVSYLKTKVARFGLSINKISKHTTIPRYSKNVPIPPLDRIWTEKTISDYYGLTVNQRKLIDDTIADYDY